MVSGQTGAVAGGRGAQAMRDSASGARAAETGCRGCRDAPLKFAPQRVLLATPASVMTT